MIVSIEGNIGVGKTTFIEAICSIDPSICVIEEPWEDDNGMLERYYKEPHIYAFPFQISMITRRAENQFLNIFNSNKDYIIERTIGADRNIFTKLVNKLGYMDEFQYRECVNIHKSLSHFIKEPDLTIYLRGNIKFLMKHIDERDRVGEDNITEEYLSELELLYDEWLCDLSNVVTVPINRNLSIDEMYNIFKECKEKIYG